jgi:hypothetical protein
MTHYFKFEYRHWIKLFVKEIVMETAKKTNIPLDLLTIMAIGIVSFILKNVLHEAVGHGGVCLLVGGTPLALSTAHFDFGYASVSESGIRWVAAGGTIINFIAAFIFWLMFRNLSPKSLSLKYFFWLAMSGNYFVAAGYPLFSGVLGVGDWMDVIQGWQPVWAWRILLTLSGLILYLWGVWFTLREMKTLIGSDPNERLIRAFKLTLFPYLAGATISSIGAFFNPIGVFVMFTSAAASFGGSSAFAWMSQMLKTKWFPQRSENFVNIERNWVWIILAIALAIIHIFIFGPSIQFKG